MASQLSGARGSSPTHFRVRVVSRDYTGVSGVGSSLLELGGGVAPQLLGLGDSPQNRCSMCLADGHKQPVAKTCHWSPGDMVGWAGGLCCPAALMMPSSWSLPALGSPHVTEKQIPDFPQKFCYMYIYTLTCL